MPVTRRNWVNVPKLADYEKTFQEYFHFKRKDGILQVQMHYDNGPVIWSYQMHHAIAELWTCIGHDKENEVLIFTGTGDKWIAMYDVGSFHEFDTKPTSDRFNVQIYDTLKIVENFINDIDIPTITAFNGPGLHWEMGILSDLAICTPDFVIRDDHFIMPPGHVPGDGMFMALQHLIGNKRANYVEYLGAGYSAQDCVNMGLINEIVEREKLLDRAWEMARKIMQSNRTSRRMTHQLSIRPWQRLMADNYKLHVMSEMYNKALEAAKSGFDKIEKY
ncbi:MAG TPA: enoyl-CoA hydratase/isomerase family protein [Dehalococcoidia bacterium]|nr:enoyl-CoA hydratase/isomerase family protein [Dehalococcoidia bacterium]